MMDEDPRQTTYYWLLAGLTAIAAITRCYGIGLWPWVGDELFSVLKAGERAVSFTNPAYYALVLGSFKLFGFTEWASRLPAVLFAVASVPVFALTWRNIIGRNAALFGALIIIVSYWHLHYSQFSRFYSAVFFFGVLAYYFYYRALREDSLKLLVWSWLACALGILFHATFVLVPAACGLYAALILLMQKFMGGRFAAEGYSQRIAKIYFVVCGAVVLLLLPLLSSIASKWNSLGESWGYSPFKLCLQFIKYVQVPVAMSALIGALLLLHKARLKGLFFVVCIGIPVLLLTLLSGFMSVRPDFVFYTLPLIVALAGYLCEQSRRLMSERRFGALALPAVLVVALLPPMASYYTDKLSLDVREATAFVNKHHQGGDFTVTFLNGFRYYAGGDSNVLPYPGWPHDNAIEWNEALDPYKTMGDRLWIVLPINRKPLAQELEQWLLKNASLVWRKTAQRYDYSVRGIQVFLAQGVKTPSLLALPSP